ncbi:hypothetical protein L9H26_19115 [Morganella psychrotolerans]|uniref:Uncharacterized protein n=1 Tax=Morganella psychrotolerans TaxID=368603 RepID=A0A5M9QXV6_9GAMM|nr:hypothetical protein [Morganella psychrotolerans]KAA8713011.1 hypothetical protein F4V73_18010 [Morganella psychrotolerans]
MEMTTVSPLITDKVREKAKLAVMSSRFGAFIIAATNLEIARHMALLDGERVNRRLRSVAKGMMEKCGLDELNRLLRELATSSNTDKAYSAILSYRDSFLTSAETRIAEMNVYCGGDLDELIEQGADVEALTSKVAEFRKLYAQRAA